MGRAIPIFAKMYWPERTAQQAVRYAVLYWYDDQCDEECYDIWDFHTQKFLSVTGIISRVIYRVHKNNLMDCTYVERLVTHATYLNEDYISYTKHLYKFLYG